MINLLPPKRLTLITIARRNSVLLNYILLIAGGALFLFLVIIIGGHYLGKQHKAAFQQSEADAKSIKDYQPVEQKAKELSSTINTIAGLFAKDLKFSDLLTQIGSVMPEGAVLTSLRFSIDELDSPLEIKAQVDSQEKAAVLRNNLDSSNLFSSAEIVDITAITTVSTATGGTVGPYRYNTTLNVKFKKSALESKL